MNKKLVARRAVFAGGCSLGAVESMCSDWQSSLEWSTDSSGGRKSPSSLSSGTFTSRPLLQWPPSFNMTPGSSGGGWFARFDGTRYGYVNGVNSTTSGRTMESPYFGEAARKLWSFVKGN